MVEGVKKLPRRTVKEMLYEMKRGGQDRLLLVEGSSDKRFYTAHLKDRLSLESVRRVFVTPVSFVEVPSNWLSGEENYRNNRSLVAATARNLDQLISVKFLGIIDRDCGVPEQWRSIERLLVSDFPAIESFAFTPRVLARFVDFFTRDETVTGDALFEELSIPLSFLYEVRREVGGMPQAVGKLIEYDGSWILHEEKVPSVSRTPLGDDDPRSRCYGHDLVQVLRLRFPSVKRQYIRDEELEALLVSHVSREDIPGNSVIAQVAAWVSEAA